MRKTSCPVCRESEASNLVLATSTIVRDGNQTFNGTVTALPAGRPRPRIGKHDGEEGRDRHEVGDAADGQHARQAEGRGDQRDGRGADHRKAAVDAPGPEEHVLLAQPRQPGHGGRHREPHQECGRRHGEETDQQPPPIGQGADQHERSVEEQPVADQDDADGQQDARQDLSGTVEDLLRREAAEPREDQHGGDQDGGRHRGVVQRQRVVGDQPHLDNDIAEPEAGEVEDRAALAGRVAEDGPPSEDDRDGHQRYRRDRGDAERRPEQQVSPFVLHDFQPVEQER